MVAPTLTINPGTTINAGVTLNGYNPVVTLTSGTSLGFNGTPGWVAVADNPGDWNLGDNWTIEWWEKLPDAGDGMYRGVIGQSVASGLDFWHNAGYINVSNAQIQFNQPTPGVWHHIAVQKDGTTVKAYIDGVSQTLLRNDSGASTLANGSQEFIIGDRTFDGNSPLSQSFNGQLANIRISSIARYSGTFTPPTTVAVDANTRLALDSSVGSSGMLVDATGRHAIGNLGATLTTIT
jgi:hypothetical protein